MYRWRLESHPLFNAAMQNLSHSTVIPRLPIRKNERSDQPINPHYKQSVLKMIEPMLQRATNDRDYWTKLVAMLRAELHQCNQAVVLEPPSIRNKRGRISEEELRNKSIIKKKRRSGRCKACVKNGMSGEGHRSGSSACPLFSKAQQVSSVPGATVIEAKRNEVSSTQELEAVDVGETTTESSAPYDTLSLNRERDNLATGTAPNEVSVFQELLPATTDT